MASTIQLKRSALSGKVPDTGSLNLGELALNTYDGKIFFRRSGSTDTVQEVITTNTTNTGSINIIGNHTITGSLNVLGSSRFVGSISQTGSTTITGSLIIANSANPAQKNTLTTDANGYISFQNVVYQTGIGAQTGYVNLLQNYLIVANPTSSGYMFSANTNAGAGTQDAGIRRLTTGSIEIFNGTGDTSISNRRDLVLRNISGSTANFSGDVTVLGSINARQFNIGIISSSIMYTSGSNKFGDTLDDTHQFTGSVGITGSLLINGVAVGGSSNSGSFTGSFSGSFVGDGSGLRGVVSDDIPRDGWDYQSNSSASISDFNASSDKYQIDFAKEPSTSVGTPVGYKGFLSNVSGSTQIVPTLNTVDFIVGNNVVASIGSNGIQASAPAGTVSGSSQLTSSYDSRYVLSGSITQTTWDNIASKPGGIISGSSQLTSSVLATTGSNSFIGNQNISGTIYLTGSIIPNSDNLYDLGSSTKSFRHLYVSSGSIYLNGAKVLSSTAQELQFTTDAGQSIKILEAGSDTITLQSADGNITLTSSGGGDVILDPTNGVIGLKGTTTLYSGNKIVSSDGNAIQFGNDLGITGSLVTTGNVNGINLTTFSSSIATTFNTVQSNTGSLTNRINNLETTSASVNGHITDINTKTGSFENKFTTLQTLTSSVQAQIARIQESTASLNAATSSYARTNSTNIFSGNQTITGSLFVSQDLVVAGSSSIQNISSSNLIIGAAYVTLNTNSPSSRYAGLLIIDSGSAGSSGSILYDAVDDELLFIHKGNGTNVTSSHFLCGPETYDNLGNEIYLTKNRITKGGNYEHLADSNINDDGTTISLNSNTQITGSLIISNGITGSIGATNGVVSGSSQVVSILSSLNSFSASNGNTSLNTYTASIDTKFTTLQSLTASNSASIGQINAVTASLNAATSSYETKGRGIVSGSSQVDVMSTTNIARLATTGSNTFTGTQTLAATTNLTDSTATGNGDKTVSIVANKAGVGYHNLSIGGYQHNFYVGGSQTLAMNIGTTGTITPGANGTQDLGSTSLRWSTIYTSDLSLNNGIGDWTIVEGEDDLFLYNNKKGKVYKFALTEVDPNVATPKKS